MTLSPKNPEKPIRILFQEICFHLLQILSSNVPLTFCGFRTLMTCVMVPVLNAGTMLLLGDRSCSWNVWGEQKALFRKSNTLHTMSERATNKKSRCLDDGSSNILPTTTFYLSSRYEQFIWYVGGLSPHGIYKTPTVRAVVMKTLPFLAERTLSYHFAKSD